MYIYKYLYIYIYICIYTCICIHVYMYVYKRTHIYIHTESVYTHMLHKNLTCAHTRASHPPFLHLRADQHIIRPHAQYMFVHLYVNTYADMNTCIRIHILSIYTCMYTYTFIYIDVHIYIHI